MKLFVLFCLVASTLATKIEYPEEWHLWKSEHGKEYSDDLEELQRHITWQANKEYIDRHNEMSDYFGYTLKMNHFGDMVSYNVIYFIV